MKIYAKKRVVQKCRVVFDIEINSRGLVDEWKITRNRLNSRKINQRIVDQNDQ